MTAAAHRFYRPTVGDGRAKQAACVGLGLIALVSLTGAAERVLFNQPSTLKYLLTIAIPLLGIALLAARRPLLVTAVGIFVIAPFSFVTTFAGLAISPLEVVVAVGALLAWLIGDQDRTRSPLGAAVLAFAIFLALPMLEGADQSRYMLVLLTGFGAAYVISLAARRPDEWIVLLYAFIISCTVQAGIAIQEFVTGHRLNLYGAANGNLFGTDYFFNFDSVNRPSAAFPDPIALGNVLALACPLVAMGAILAKTLRAKLACALCGIVIVTGLAATLSRLSWIGALAGSLTAIVLLSGSQRVKAFIGAAIAAIVAVGLAIAAGGPALFSRVASISDPTNSQVETAQGDVTRLQLQHVAVSVGDAHPFAGVGIGRLTPYLVSRVPGVSGATHAHSTYYQLYAEAGILGLLALASPAAGVIVCCVALFRSNRQLAAGSLGALVALLFVFATDYTVRNPSVLAMVAAIFGMVSGAYWKSRWEP